MTNAIQRKNFFVYLFGFLCLENSFKSLNSTPSQEYTFGKDIKACNRSRGETVVTTLLTESKINITWDLEEENMESFSVELRDADDKLVKSYSTNNLECQQNSVLPLCTIELPTQVCFNCSLYLIHQSKNVTYLNCNNINIRPEDECSQDEKCQSEGKCLAAQKQFYSYNQCFCKNGRFGEKCNKVSSGKEKSDSFSDHNHQNLSDNIEMFWKILTDSNEIEIILQINTTGSFEVVLNSQGQSYECSKFFEQNKIQANHAIVNIEHSLLNISRQKRAVSKNDNDYEEITTTPMFQRRGFLTHSPHKISMTSKMGKVGNEETRQHINLFTHPSNEESTIPIATKTSETGNISLSTNFNGHLSKNRETSMTNIPENEQITQTSLLLTTVAADDFLNLDDYYSYTYYHDYIPNVTSTIYVTSTNSSVFETTTEYLSPLSNFSSSDSESITDLIYKIDDTTSMKNPVILSPNVSIKETANIKNSDVNKHSSTQTINNTVETELSDKINKSSKQQNTESIKISNKTLLKSNNETLENNSLSENVKNNEENHQKFKNNATELHSLYNSDTNIANVTIDININQPNSSTTDIFYNDTPLNKSDNNIITNNTQQNETSLNQNSNNIPTDEASQTETSLNQSTKNVTADESSQTETSLDQNFNNVTTDETPQTDTSLNQNIKNATIDESSQTKSSLDQNFNNVTTDETPQTETSLNQNIKNVTIDESSQTKSLLDQNFNNITTGETSQTEISLNENHKNESIDISQNKTLLDQRFNIAMTSDTSQNESLLNQNYNNGMVNDISQNKTSLNQSQNETIYNIQPIETSSNKNINTITTDNFHQNAITVNKNENNITTGRISRINEALNKNIIQGQRPVTCSDIAVVTIRNESYYHINDYYPQNNSETNDLVAVFVKQHNGLTTITIRKKITDSAKNTSIGVFWTTELEATEFIIVSISLQNSNQTNNLQDHTMYQDIRDKIIAATRQLLENITEVKTILINDTWDNIVDIKILLNNNYGNVATTAEKVKESLFPAIVHGEIGGIPVKKGYLLVRVPSDYETGTFKANGPDRWLIHIYGIVACICIMALVAIVLGSCKLYRERQRKKLRKTFHRGLMASSLWKGYPLSGNTNPIFEDFDDKLHYENTAVYNDSGMTLTRNEKRPPVPPMKLVNGEFRQTSNGSLTRNGNVWPAPPPPFNEYDTVPLSADGDQETPPPYLHNHNDYVNSFHGKKSIAEHSDTSDSYFMPKSNKPHKPCVYSGEVVSVYVDYQKDGH